MYWVLSELANLHTLGVVVLLVTVDVVVRYLLLAHPALLLRLLMALAAARLGVPDEEDLTELDTAVFTPEEGHTVTASDKY